MLVRVMVLFQLVIIVIAGGVLSDDGRRYRGVVPLQPHRESPDLFQNAGDGEAARRLQRRSTAAPGSSSLASRRRATAHARAALRRRLVHAGDPEMLFTSETRNAHAGRLPPPEEDTTKPPTKEEKDGSSESKEVTSSPRYVLRGRRPPYTVLDRRASTNSSRNASDDDEALKQRKRRPSKDDDDDDDSDDGDSSEESGGEKRDESEGGRVSDERKVVRKRRPGVVSGAESKDKDRESERGRRSSTAAPTQQATTAATSLQAGDAASSSVEEAATVSRKRRPSKPSDSGEEVTKPAEVSHKRRRPTEPLPASSPPFHPMLPAASALTMSDSLYNHFRPLGDVPEDHLLPFLSFGKKLPAKAAVVRQATGSTNSLLPEAAAAGHGLRGGWLASTSAPPTQQRAAAHRRPPEDVLVDEHMDVALVRAAVERNKAPRGGVASGALRTLYSSTQRRPSLDESTTTTSSEPSPVDGERGQNGSADVAATTPGAAEADATRSTEGPTSPSTPTDVPPTSTPPPKTLTPVVVTYRRRSTTTTASPSPKPDVTSDSSSSVTIATSDITSAASPSTNSTTRSTATSFIAPSSTTAGSTTVNRAATTTTTTTTTTASTTTSSKPTPSITTTTVKPSPLNERPSSRWTIIVTTPPAPQETFPPPPPRFTRKPAAVSYTHHSPKTTMESTTTELKTTPPYESSPVTPVQSSPTLPSTVSESSDSPSTQVSSLPTSTYPFRIRITPSPSAFPVRDPLPHKPRNTSIYSTLNRRPFLRKPPAKMVTATSSPDQRNLTEPPQFTNSVYMDVRHPLLSKPNNISWLPLSQEIPVKNFTKIPLQRPVHKYPRPDITLRRRPTLRDNEHASMIENTSPVTEVVRLRENESVPPSVGANLGSAVEESPADVRGEGTMLGLSPPPPTTKILSTAVVTSVSVQGEWRSPASTTVPPALLPLPLELTADAILKSSSSSGPALNRSTILDSSSGVATTVGTTVQGNADATTVSSTKKESSPTSTPLPRSTEVINSSEVSSSSSSPPSSTSEKSEDIPVTEQQKQSFTREASSVSSQIGSITQRPVYKGETTGDPTLIPELPSEPLSLTDRNIKNVTVAPSSSTPEATTEGNSHSSEAGAPTSPSPPAQEVEKATQPHKESAATTTVVAEPTSADHTPGMTVFERPDKEYDLPIVHLYNGSSTVWMTEATIPTGDGEQSTQKTVTTEVTGSSTPKTPTGQDTGSPESKTNATGGGPSTPSNSSYRPGVQWGAGVQPACGNFTDCFEAAAPTPDSEDPEDSWGMHAGMYALGVLCTVPLAIGAAFGVRYLARKRRKFLDESDTCSEVSCPPRGLISRADTDIDADSKAARLQTHLTWDQETLPTTCWEVPRSKLRLQTVLGQGNFGQVLKAEIDDICGGIGSTRLVAVKTVKEDASQRDKDDLLREMEIMKTLGAHPNVVTLLGCCTEIEPHLLIMEYVMYGKLLAYLRDHRTRRKYFNFCEDDSDALTSRDLTIFAYCVARGMEYLTSRGIIHRDLAARNVLVDHNKMCKVADFGMSRSVQDLGDVYEQRHTKGALPIRWMAPESLLYRIFTHKSDVWSFGILIWEIVTLGSTPYPGQSAREVVRLVREGGRLERPPHCRPEFFRLASRCWHHDPGRRPSFGEIKRELAALVEDERFGGGYVDLDAFADHGYCYGRIPTAVRPSANNTADTTTTAEECDAEVISM